MSIYSPQKYIPFKRRIRIAFIGTLGVVGFMFLHNVIPELSKNTNSPAHTNSMSQSDQTLIFIFLAIMVLFLIGIIIFSQVWVLDEVIIDPKTKKMRVLIRKFDTIIDKGEFDIDDNLKVKISTKKGHKNIPITAIRLKYGKKIIFSQSNSDFAGAPNWLSISFLNIRDEVEHIKKTNPSIQGQG